MMNLEIKEIDKLFNRVYRAYCSYDQVEHAQRVLSESRTSENNYVYYFDYDFEKKVQLAIALRRELVRVYSSENHKVIFDAIEKRLYDENFYLGFMLFFDYLHSEKIYPIFTDKDRYHAKETVVRNKLIFKIIQRADNYLNGNLSYTKKSVTNAKLIFFELAFCYKYLYSYQPDKADINFFHRYDANRNGKYLFGDFAVIMHGILQKVCLVQKKNKSDVRFDFLLQVEADRDQDDRAEERQVSYKGMHLLLLKNDQSIKFIALYFLYDFLHKEMIYNYPNRVKYMQRFFFESSTHFSHVDQRFMWMYLQLLLQEKEYELYGHLLRMCPDIYAVLKEFFKKQNKSYTDMLLKESDDEHGYLINAIYSNEFDKDIGALEAFAREKGIYQRYEWFEWFITLVKYTDRLKNATDKEEQEKLKEDVLVSMKALSEANPISGYAIPTQQYFSELLFDLMIAYAEIGGDLYRLIRELGENNLLNCKYGNWSMLKHVRQNYTMYYKEWDRLIKYLEGLSPEVVWELYVNSPVRFVIGIQDVMNIIGDRYGQISQMYTWEYRINRVNPEEKEDRAIELSTYDHYVDENYVLQPDDDWVMRNYTILSRRFTMNRVLHGVPYKTCDGVIYVKIDEDICTDETGAKQPDYDNAFQWLKLIRDNIEQYVYNPFILFHPFYKMDGGLNRRYLTDMREQDFSKQRRSVWYLPKPDEEETRNKFAISIFETMLSLKNNKNSVGRLIHFLADTSMYPISEYHYEFGKNLDDIKKADELSKRARGDLKRLCAVDKAANFELLQNIINIYANTYLKQYVDLYELFEELSKDMPAKILRQVGMVQAYGYEERLYNSFYFRFQLCDEQDYKKHECYLKQPDVFHEEAKNCIYAGWNYKVKNEKSIQFRTYCNGHPVFFQHKRTQSIYMKLDEYNNKKVYIKDVKNDNKARDAEDLENAFQRLYSKEITEEEQKSLMATIKESLIKMKNLDVVKQLFLARNIDRVLVFHAYDVNLALKFAQMIKSVESETHVKVFDLDRPGFREEEKAFAREEMRENAENFIDDAIAKMNARQYKRGLKTFVYIFDRMLYNQCISRKKLKKKLTDGLKGRYSEDDINDFLSKQ